ncbi:MAG: DUF362 domain-containing protein [Phycisphaerae bacterium]|nr:DUF362 domain-containing protein [Phycisphaerae bacterium]
MPRNTTRRQFLVQAGVVTAGIALPLACDGSSTASKIDEKPRASVPSEPRVVIARDETLTRGKVAEHRDLLRKLLDAAMQRLTNATNAAAAWRRFFKPGERVGIKVNALGFSTQPAVVEAIVAGLRQAGVPAGKIIIWDRFDVELAGAGFKLNKSSSGVQCRGTDAERIGSGYENEVESRGQIGSCFSSIVAKQVDVLISVPVLKDHNLAGVSLGMKNFYGAIHNPNKYHDNNCDPFVADVVSHRYIRPKWRLTVCDGTRAQYNAGPGVHPGFIWPFGGLIVSNDFVAADAVAADLLEKQRKAKGLKSLAEEQRAPQHINTAGKRGLGVADLNKIERIEV